MGPLGRPVAAVHDGPGLHRRRPLVVVLDPGARHCVDLVLRPGVAEPVGRRGGRVDAEAVLVDVAAVGRHQADRAGVVAQCADHRGDGVAHRVVPRAAGEPQPAVDRERERVVDAELLDRELHGRREARVQVQVAQLLDAHVGQLERQVPGCPDGGGGHEVAALGHGAVLAVGAGMHEHPAVLRDAQGSGPVGRADDDGGRHVDVGVRHHALGVREPDQPVVRRGGRDLVGRVGLAAPGERVVRGDL